mgnify:CR=1 FL=1
MAQKITDANYKELLAQDKLVVVDFWQNGADRAAASHPLSMNLQPNSKEKPLSANTMSMTTTH